MMRYISTYELDTGFGDGIRNVLVLSGCAANCKDCELKWVTDFSSGKKLAPLLIGRFIRKFEDPIIRGITICGGDVFADAPFDNYSTCLRIIKGIKQNYPDRDVWIFSCRPYRSVQDTELMKYVDVYVEGKYRPDQREEEKPYRISDNQKILRRNKEGEFDDNTGMAR